eukprot:15360395-Ditylum_brightwellii.AAC.1
MAYDEGLSGKSEGSFSNHEEQIVSRGFLPNEDSGPANASILIKGTGLISTCTETTANSNTDHDNSIDSVSTMNDRASRDLLLKDTDDDSASETSENEFS